MGAVMPSSHQNPTEWQGTMLDSILHRVMKIDDVNVKLRASQLPSFYRKITAAKRGFPKFNDRSCRAPIRDDHGRF